MKVLQAEFLTSATEKSAGAGWPAEDAPEIAFAGRSNVGKSTLLQALMQRRGLVRISSTPGRTRLINFFRLVIAPEGGRGPQDRRALVFVDLPGYGYAKASKQLAAEWQDVVFAYLRGRANLRRVLLLLDARRGMMPADRAVMAVLDEAAVSYGLVLTKWDALADRDHQAARANAESEIRRHTAAYPEVFATSARRAAGLDSLKQHLAALAAP